MRPRSLPDGIDNPNDEEDNGGGDRQSLVDGWPENDLKKGQNCHGCGGVIGGNRGHSLGWCENEDLNEGNLSGLSDRLKVVVSTNNGPKEWRLWQKSAAKTPSLVATVAASMVLSGMNGKPITRRSWGCRSSSQGRAKVAVALGV